MWCAISGTTPTNAVVTPGGVVYDKALIVKAIEVRGRERGRGNRDGCMRGARVCVCVCVRAHARTRAVRASVIRVMSSDARVRARARRVRENASGKGGFAKRARGVNSTRAIQLD